MKKRNVELVMALLFIISCVSLMLNIIDRNKIENDDNYVQTTLYSDENDLYSNYYYIENKLFKKYFVVGISSQVTYIDKKQEPGEVIFNNKDIGDKYIKEKIVVNSIKYSSSYSGREAS